MQPACTSRRTAVLDARELPGVRSVERVKQPRQARPIIGPPDQAVFHPHSAQSPCESACVPSRLGWFRVAAVRLTIAVSMLTLAASSCPAIDPHSPEVRECIDRAVAYLRDNLDTVKPPEAGIVAYAIIRSGDSAESPAVKTLLRRVLDEKFKGGQYGKGTPHQFYEAGTDMMMFEAANPRHYGREIEMIATFTVDNQWPSGSWYYYTQPEHGGDTSHTQYAVLGLWAATRAGVKVSSNVWSRMAEWHLKNQLSDGGFAYHPGDVKLATHSMTVNGVASLCVARMMLYPNRRYPSPFDSLKEDEDQSDRKSNTSELQSPVHLVCR